MAKNTWKAIEAANRRRDREAQKRQKELLRRAKEHAKLSALQAAQVEVDEYENRLELITSIHKEECEAWDWYAEALSLPPPIPLRSSYHEQRVNQTLTLEPAAVPKDGELAKARMRDDEAHSAALKVYDKERAEWADMVGLAKRICSLEPKAYLDALDDLDPLSELSEYGASAKFAIHNPQVMSCELSVSGISAVPSEVKTLTASGKVSTKAMPRARFHEVYQDYICSCMLRVARESFSLLPIDRIVVSASANMEDGASRTVLSAIFSRQGISGLDFNTIDPSDAVEKFPFRGDFKASRKAGAFQAVIPYTMAEIAPPPPSKDAHIEEFVARIAALRAEIQASIQRLSGQDEPQSI